MAGNLNFADLIPERDTFTDTSGQVYEFLNRTDFGVVETARLSKAQTVVEASLERVKADTADEEAALAFESAVNDVLGLILPGLSRERLAGFTLGQKSAIVKYWNEQQETKATAVGEARAGQPARP